MSSACSREELLHLIRERASHPASARELMQLLGVAREERAAFRRRLRRLAAEGWLVEVRGHRYGLPDLMDLVVGRLQIGAGGAGAVAPDAGAGTASAPVLIPASALGQAMHGDRVVARIERHRGADRPEGRIVRILVRANTTVVGRYDRDDTGLGFVSPFDPRLGADVTVPAGDEGGARPGEMVAAEMTRWPTPTRGPIGRVIEVLGPRDAPGVDIRIIVRKHGLPDAHGADAAAEARRLVVGRGAPGTRHARRQDLSGRTDFRGLDIVTIDGEHARDFDDAISLEPLANGHARLGVHIADVSHYVREGSALDVEAYDRGTSVYFPERALHMLPEEIATGVCSLNPAVDRLVQSCLMEVDGRGAVVGCQFHDGIIRTRARLTYTEVNAVLTDGDRDACARHEALRPLLVRMRDLYQVLRDRRERMGSIDFDLNEAQVVLDEAGAVEAIIASERNVAHRIIEEFMLLANETVAEFLDRSGVPALYRVHEPPDPVKVAELEAFVGPLGYSLGATAHAPGPRQFQALLRRLRGRPEERSVAALVLRTMQKARYAPENLGHFGLAFSSYTHFTSPIRRYPDLIVHRLLRAVRQGTVSAARREALADTLPEIARHVSDRERRADEAERELLQWKKVRFMRDKVGDDFDGYITGVAPFGLFIEIIDHLVEGLVHVSTMTDDYYRVLEGAHALRGEHTRTVYALGDRVRVRVTRVDEDQRRVELGLVSLLDAPRSEGRLRRSGGRLDGQRPPGPRTHRSAGSRRPARRSR